MPRPYKHMDRVYPPWGGYGPSTGKNRKPDPTMLHSWLFSDWRYRHAFCKTQGLRACEDLVNVDDFTRQGIQNVIDCTEAGTCSHSSIKLGRQLVSLYKTSLKARQPDVCMIVELDLYENDIRHDPAKVVRKLLKKRKDYKWAKTLLETACTHYSLYGSRGLPREQLFTGPPGSNPVLLWRNGGDEE